MKNEEILKQLGTNIKKIRNEIGVSQEQLASMCGFDRTYISLIERGKRNLSYLNLVKLSKGLNVDLEKIISIKKGSKNEV
jgi:transcriptional regulator with XRE-family HTH domain